MPTEEPQESILPDPTLSDPSLLAPQQGDTTVDGKLKKKRKKKPPLLVPVTLVSEQFTATFRFTKVGGFVQLKIVWARRLSVPPYPDLVPPNVVLKFEDHADVHQPTLRWSKKVRWLAGALKFTILFEGEKYEADLPDPKEMKESRRKVWAQILAERARLAQVAADQAKPPKKGEV